MIRLALLFLVVTTISADFECPDVETPGIYADPDDCRGYYEGGLGTIA